MDRTAYTKTKPNQRQSVSVCQVLFASNPHPSLKSSVYLLVDVGYLQERF